MHEFPSMERQVKHWKLMNKLCQVRSVKTSSPRDTIAHGITSAPKVTSVQGACFRSDDAASALGDPLPMDAGSGTTDVTLVLPLGISTASAGSSWHGGSNPFSSDVGIKATEDGRVKPTKRAVCH